MNTRNQIEQYISLWENRCYSNGIPDEVPEEISDMVPSYKRIAMAILNNDHSLKSLGFTPKVSPYYSELKRIEISQRMENPTKQVVVIEPELIQLSLF